MKNTEISCHGELMDRILELRLEKELQEQILRQSFNEFAITISPVTIIKESLHELVSDTGVKSDLIQIGLNIGANFLIDKALGKRNSIKGFLSSVLMEKISSSLINGNMSWILAYLQKFMNPVNQENQQQTQNSTL